MDLAKKFKKLKDNIKQEYKYSYPTLKQVSDQMLSDYIGVGRSKIANFWRYKKETQKIVYNTIKAIDVDNLAFRVLKKYKKQAK
jgi:hypothetical protein